MAFQKRDLIDLIRLLAGPRQSLPSWLRPVVEALQSGRSRMPRNAQRGLERIEQHLLPRTAPPPIVPPDDPEPEPESNQPPPRHPRTRQPQGFPEEQQNFSDEFLTPTSSNVWSFQYYRPPGDSGREGNTKGILYVTYKANKIQARARGRQLRGEHGSTVGGKVNKAGSTYAYFDVPLSVFNGMKAAYSKGHYVWEALRVEHSVWGHRYRYQLVVGQVLKKPGGGLANYVPRKITKKGFVTRSVADIGTGRRGFVSSTLPAGRTGTGFTTRGRR